MMDENHETVLKILQRFCQHSTVRGLPRVYRETSIIWKAIWLIGVIAFTIMSSYFCIKSILRYYEYKTIPVERVINQEEVDLPALILCTRKSSDYKNDDKMKKIYQMTEEVFHRSEYIQSQMDELILTQVFLENFYTSPASEGSRDMPNNFINKCQLKYSRLTMPNAMKTINCTEDMIQSALNCKVIKPTLHETNLASNSLIVEVYLNNINDTIIYDGVRYGIQDRNTIKFLYLKLLEMGKQMNAEISATSQTKLPNPYGNCLDKLTSAQQSQCQQDCTAKNIFETCKCQFMPEMNKQLTKEYSKLHVCFSVDNYDTVDLLVKEAECVIKMRHESTECCAKQCHESCKTRRYTSAVIIEPWLSAIGRRHIQRYVKNIKQMKPEVSRNILRGFNATAIITAHEMTTEIQNFRYRLETNFLKITVQLLNSDIRYVTDTPEFGVTKLMASVGGYLSLYSGITTMLGIELLELFWELSCHMYKRLKRKKVPKITTINVYDVNNAVSPKM